MECLVKFIFRLIIDVVGFKSTIIFIVCVCVSVAPKLAMYNLDLLDIFLSQSCVGRMSFNKLQSTMKFLHHT